MTIDEIMYKAFLIIWKVQRQNQSEYYFAAEKYIKQYINRKITKDQIVMIYPEGVDVLIEKQKELNLEMFIKAILATSDDRFEKAKRLNPYLIKQVKKLKNNHAKKYTKID